MKLYSATHYAYRLIWHDQSCRQIITIASLLIHLLSLATPLFVVTLLQKYVTHGRTSTLIYLTTSVITAIFLERKMRIVRQNILLHIFEKRQRAHHNQWADQFIQTPLIAIMQIPNLIRSNWKQRIVSSSAILNSNTLCGLWDLPFALIYVLIVILIQPILGLIVITLTLIGIRHTQRQLNQQVTVFKREKISQQIKHDLAEKVIDKYEYLNEEVVKQVNEQWEPMVNEDTEYQLIKQKMQSDLHTFTITLMSLLTVLLYAYGSHQVVSGHFSIALLIATNIIASKAMAPLLRIPAILNEVIDLKYQIENKQAVDNLPKYQQTVYPKALKGYINIENLSFDYPNDSHCLTNVSAVFKPRAITIVTGASGSGKTTLCRILLGQLRPKSGHLSYDNMDIQHINPIGLQRHITYCGHDCVWLGQQLWHSFETLKKNTNYPVLVKLLNIGDTIDFIYSNPQEDVSDTLSKLSLVEIKYLQLVKALSNPKKIILIDEPFLKMSDSQRKLIDGVLDYLKHKHHTIVVLTASNNPMAQYDHHVELGGL